MRIVLKAQWSASVLLATVALYTILNIYNIKSLLVPNTKKEMINKADVGFHRDPRVIAHLHMVKTGGTSLNGQLALNYEQVCGHKGWSYDAYLVNQRAGNKSWGLVRDSFTTAADYNNKMHTKHKHRTKRKHRSDHTNIEKKRVVTSNATRKLALKRKKKKTFSRGRVPSFIGDEIGYHDCDYISEERSWEFWPSISKVFDPIPVELHVPCRDPIDHLMSQCNHIDRKFDCTSSDLLSETTSCFAGVLARFNNSLLNTDNLIVFCYDYNLQFTDYTNYITPKLQKKRIQSEYVHRESNLPRNKTAECIWKDPILVDKVKDILMTFDYYDFCNQCIGSADDLFSQKNQKMR